jgi:hypothetical protein
MANAKIPISDLHWKIDSPESDSKDLSNDVLHVAIRPIAMELCLVEGLTT